MVRVEIVLSIEDPDDLGTVDVIEKSRQLNFCSRVNRSPDKDLI